MTPIERVKESSFGRQAFEHGVPFDPSRNECWQRGWKVAEFDQNLENGILEDGYE